MKLNLLNPLSPFLVELHDRLEKEMKAKQKEDFYHTHGLRKDASYEDGLYFAQRLLEEANQ